MFPAVPGPEHPPKFTDMMGQEVRVHDTVAYATGRGSSAEMKIGFVQEINWIEKMDGGYYEFKVWAEWTTPWSGHLAVPASAQKPSKPTRGRMVRVAKGRNW